MKIFEFLKYLFKGIFSEIFEDLSEIFLVITKKKTWVVVCFIFFIISLFLGQPKLVVLAGVLFLFFFLTYQWQVFSEQYIHEQREKYLKKARQDKKDGR